MGMIKTGTVIGDVHHVRRPGVGDVYVGTITIRGLVEALREGIVQYAPKYQRGFRQNSSPDDPEPKVLLKIDDERLDINRERAANIAVKYLMATHGVDDKKLFNPDVVWNARADKNKPAPKFDPESRTLTVSTAITIPDSGHRHYAYFLIGEWQDDPASIPESVEVEEGGLTATNTDIAKWVKNLDLSREVDGAILVHIFNLSREDEGRLFDEYNVDGKAPSSAVSMDLAANKDPSRRFIYSGLMKKSRIFAETEVEKRRNTIGSKSRKLTTNATLVTAIRPYAKSIYELEQKSPSAHADLVDFFCAFFEEWAMHYPEFQPGASAEERHALRERSFALSNIMMYPLFHLIMELWNKYQKDAKDWRTDTKWKDVISRLAGKTTVAVSDENGHIRNEQVEVMSRPRPDKSPPMLGNPKWQESILVAKFDKDGKPERWSLSSTRQTRQAAYQYLKSIADL